MKKLTSKKQIGIIESSNVLVGNIDKTLNLEEKAFRGTARKKIEVSNVFYWYRNITVRLLEVVSEGNILQEFHRNIPTHN